MKKMKLETINQLGKKLFLGMEKGKKSNKVTKKNTNVIQVTNRHLTLEILKVKMKKYYTCKFMGLVALAFQTLQIL